MTSVSVYCRRLKLYSLIVNIQTKRRKKEQSAKEILDLVLCSKMLNLCIIEFLGKTICYLHVNHNKNTQWEW